MLNLLLGIFVCLLIVEYYKKENDLDEEAYVTAVVMGILAAMFPKIMLLFFIISISYGLGKSDTPKRGDVPE